MARRKTTISSVASSPEELDGLIRPRPSSPVLISYAIWPLSRAALSRSTNRRREVDAIDVSSRQGQLPAELVAGRNGQRVFSPSRSTSASAPSRTPRSSSRSRASIRPSCSPRPAKVRSSHRCSAHAAAVATPAASAMGHAARSVAPAATPAPVPTAADGTRQLDDTPGPIDSNGQRRDCPSFSVPSVSPQRLGRNKTRKPPENRVPRLPQLRQRCQQSCSDTLGCGASARSARLGPRTDGKCLHPYHPGVESPVNYLDPSSSSTSARSGASSSAMRRG